MDIMVFAVDAAKIEQLICLCNADRFHLAHHQRMKQKIIFRDAPCR